MYDDEDSGPMNPLEKWVHEQLDRLTLRSGESDIRGLDDQDFYQEFLRRSDDARALFFLAYEMQFRSQIPNDFRGAVILHLASLIDLDGDGDLDSVDLLSDDGSQHQAGLSALIDASAIKSDSDPNEKPGSKHEREKVDFPHRDLRETRWKSRAQHAERGRDWREVGLLSLSGYHVGRTSSLRTSGRREILNWIYLEDDLGDLDDREYARTWGAPGSSKRLKKMADSLAAFISHRRDVPADYSIAISHWEADLRYLKDTFHEPSKHKWTWPKVV